MKPFFFSLICFLLLGRVSSNAQEHELKYDWHISVSSDGKDIGLRKLFQRGDHFIAIPSGHSGNSIEIETPFEKTTLSGADTSEYILLFNPDGSFKRASVIATTSRGSEFYISRIEEQQTGEFIILGTIEGAAHFSPDENSFQLSSSAGQAHCFLEMTEDFKISNGFLLNPNGSAHIWDFTLLDNGDIGLVGEIEDTTDIAPRKDEFILVAPKEEGDYGLRASYFLLLDSSYSIKNYRLFPDDPELFLTDVTFTKDQNFLILSDFFYEAFLPTDYSMTELVRVGPFSWASALLKADSTGNFFDHAIFPHFHLINSFNNDAESNNIPCFVVIFDYTGVAQYQYREFQDDLEARNIKTLLSYERDNPVNLYLSKFADMNQIHLSGNTRARVDFDPNPDRALMNRESCSYNFLYKVETSGDMEIEYLHEDSMGYQGGFIPLDIIEMNNQVITCGSANNEMLINACQENEIYLNHEDAAGVIISYEKSKPTSTIEAEASRGYFLINNPENQYFVLKNSSNETLNYELIDVYGRTLIQGTCSDASCKIEWPDYSGVYFMKLADKDGDIIGTDILRSP